MTPREIAERHLRKWANSGGRVRVADALAAACEEAAAEARRAEREACAAIADSHAAWYKPGSVASQHATRCAEAIRARKEAE